MALQLSLAGPHLETPPSNIEEIMRDGILWGVPKKKPSLERRLRRRFGVPAYPQDCRILRPRFDLIICEQCGDHHEAHTICRTCYAEVRQETDQLKSEIRKQIDQLKPKEQEVIVRFKDDPNDQDPKKFCIVEIERERPAWFPRNLLTLGNLSRPSKGFITRPEDLVSFKKE